MRSSVPCLLYTSTFGKFDQVAGSDKDPKALVQKLKEEGKEIPKMYLCLSLIHIWNKSPERHRGHVVNTQYPENPNMRQAESTLSFEDFVSGIQSRGMDRFMANGPQIRIDTTELSKVNTDEIVKRVCALRDELSASVHSAEQENKNG